MEELSGEVCVGRALGLLELQLVTRLADTIADFGQS